ncbi:MAG TPA: transferrin-binding protein-like solute binding protein [Burkholderiales bacterium]|nr:transferrin-binding protein-like solute binding protein [Burkholderiales bacterium]
MDLPTTGTAAYNGYFIGRYVTSTPFPAVGTYVVGANANAQVDFSGAGAVTFSTSYTHISKELSGGGLGSPQQVLGLDLSSAPMTISRTTMSNSFAGGAGTLTNAFGMGANGQIAGAFYGPPASTAPYAPPEMGGSLAVSNPTNTQSMVGSFALKH